MNLVRVAVVLAALPFLVFPPLAILVVLALGYLTYGLPFVVVARDAGVLPGILFGAAVVAVPAVAS